MWEALSEPFRYRKLDISAGQADTTAVKRPKQKAKNWQATLRRIWHYLSHRKGRLSLGSADGSS